jgi:hypothetical protein
LFSSSEVLYLAAVMYKAVLEASRQFWGIVVCMRLTGVIEYGAYWEARRVRMPVSKDRIDNPTSRNVRGILAG